MESGGTRHNLGLFRLEGFSGMRRDLLALHDWLTTGDDLPAIALSGDQGSGKSTLSTAAAWNHIHHFADGIIRVSPAGANPFRLYDVVRTMDTVLGTALTRMSPDRWGLAILEQLYRRKRLLLIDKLAGAAPHEIDQLAAIIGHLHEHGGQSRILLIDRNFSPATAQLVKYQHLHLVGLDIQDLPEFIWKRAPAAIRSQALNHPDLLFALTRGAPLCLRLALGLLLDQPLEELAALLGTDADGPADPDKLCAIATESAAQRNPSAVVLLNRLVRTVGGVTLDALLELFWTDLGTREGLRGALMELEERGLLELDRFRRRAFIHPLVRRYLEENAVMMGEEWHRRHAAFYVRVAEQYQQLPIQRWPDIDLDWGNIFAGADWCAERLKLLCGCDPLAIISDPTFDATALAARPELKDAYADLLLARNYALALADYAFWRHPPGIVRWLAVGAVAAAAMQDMRNFAWFLMNIGRQMFFMDRLSEAIIWLERARPIFDERDMLTELAYLYTDLGTTYRVLDDSRHALDNFLAAFDCVVQLGDPHSLSTAYMNLGSAYYSLHQYDRALIEHRKAMRIALRSMDRSLVASVYNNMGLALEALDRTSEAIAAYEHALTMFRQIDDAVGVSACYNNLGSACYAQSNFPAALQWYDSDRQLLEQRSAWIDLAATLHNLGHAALETGDLEHSLIYFTRSRDLYAAFDLSDYANEEEEMIDVVRTAQLTSGSTAAPR